MPPELTIVQGSDDGRALALRDDDALMLLLCQGEKDAFRVMVERHGARLRSFCTKMLCDALLGEELAQDTWCQIYSARERYRPNGQFVVFLFTIARNRCRNALRSRRRQLRWLAPVEILPERPSEHGGADERLLDEERRIRLFDAFAELPDTQRAAAILRFQEDLGYEAIAETIGCTVVTARSHVHRALCRLRKAVGDQGGE
jgi:RNA polymerase sigma-70 factor (ECF subfamily)